MTTHELKTDPALFDAVARGDKTHEIRLNDRGFAVGDILHLREIAASGKQMSEGAPLAYTGRAALREVSHIQILYGLAHGWCILSFKTKPSQPWLDMTPHIDAIRAVISQLTPNVESSMMILDADRAKRVQKRIEERRAESISVPVKLRKGSEHRTTGDALVSSVEDGVQDALYSGYVSLAPSD